MFASVTRWSMALVVVAGLGLGGCSSDDDKGRVICPVDGKCGAKSQSYKELSQQWWQWISKIPAAKSPMVDPNGSSCAEQQPSDTVWFLAGTPPGADQPTKRSCAVPSGRGLFLPVVALLCTACKKDEDCEVRPDCSEEPQTDAHLNACLEGAFPDAVDSLEAKVDGEPVADLMGFRTESGIFSVTGPTDAADRTLPCTAGERKAIADGYYLFVEPLAAGKHTVMFKGSTKQGFSLHVEYAITVE